MGERVAGCDGSTGIRWKCPLLEEIGTTHTDMEASSRRKEGRKHCDNIHAPCIGNGESFGEEDELVVCEEVAGFLQRTYYERLTLYGMWHKRIASKPRRSASGKKSKARRHRRTRR